MANYKRKRKIYKLDFEGTEYDGLEVRVRGLTTGEYLQIIQLSAASGDEGDKETEGMLKMFASHLIGWNLTDEEDEPVPTSYEGVVANDFVMNMAIITAWTNALGEPTEKLEKKSSSGDLALVASIPTETLSQSQVS